MDAERQRKITRIGYGILIAILLGGGMALLHGGCSRDSATGSTGADSTSATQQVERAADLNERARAENQSAREAVERADQRAAEAADLNQRVTERLESSRQLIDEIRADNKKAKQIIDELIAGHQGEPAQGEKN